MFLNFQFHHQFAKLYLSSNYFLHQEEKHVNILYYFGTIEGSKNQFFTIGALMTTLLFFLTTYGFGIYIENFSNYNQLYGSIGALLIFLLYIWMNSNILLLGFELNATLTRFKREPKVSSDGD
jgi:YihY family inner membrane protein